MTRDPRVLKRCSACSNRARACRRCVARRKREVALAEAAPPPKKTPLVVSLLEATAVAAITHPIAVTQLFNGCVDMAFNSRLRTLARRPDSIGEAARALLGQIEVAEKAKPCP